MLLTVAAVIGVAAAAAVAVSARDDGSQPAAAAAACRALSGRPPLALDLPGAALPAQDQLNNDAVLRAAERRLPAGDVRISVGRLVNAYGSAGAAATLRGLQALDQSQPVVGLHEGLVQLWAGDCTAAERTLQRVRTDDLYGYYGTVADNTLHTDQRPGLPIYIPPDGTPTRLGRAAAGAGAKAPRRRAGLAGPGLRRGGGGKPAGRRWPRPSRLARSTPPPSPRAWPWR